MKSSANIGKTSSLQSYYFINMEVGLIVTLAVFIALFKAPIHPNTETEIQQVEQEAVKMEDIIQTKQPDAPPPPPRPVVPVAVPNDEVISEEVLSFDSELNLDQSLDLPSAPPEPADEESDEEEQDVFVIVEKMPKLIGGIQSVNEKINYPDIAAKAGVEGRVVVQFIINEKGDPVDPKVVRGIGGGCDKEAIRVVKTLKFEPGLQRGRPVKVRYTIPVVFKLKNN